MEPRYKKNEIHITDEEQRRIKDCKVLVAGCGIGSAIAEGLLRLGFENLTLIDGDLVELTNLNRQNYIEADIGSFKARALEKRLLDINHQARIEIVSAFITPANLKDLKIDHDIAINALDFDSDVPALFDELCCNKGIPVVHPFNLGWAGFVTVITAGTKKIITRRDDKTELQIGEYIINGLSDKKIPSAWLEVFLKEYEKIMHTSSPPQLAIGVSLLTGMVCNIIFNIATSKSYKQFPDFYYLSLRE